MTCACAACITSTAYAQESTTTPSVGSEVSETSKIDQTSTVAYRIQGSRGYIFSLSTDRTKLYSNYNTSTYKNTTIPELGSSDEDFNFVLIPSTLRDGGYYLYNVGAQKFIERNTTSTSEQLALSETPNSESFIWTITKNTFTQGSITDVSRYDGTFNFSIVNDAYYLTLSNSSIAGVKTYADPDAGSRFNLIIATTNGDYTTAVQKVNTYEQSAIGEKIKAFKQNVTSSLSANIGKMGYPTQTAWETFSQTIDNATSMSQAQTALNTLLSRANLTMPEDGKAYYIRPVNKGTAVSDRSKNRLYCDNGSLEIGVGETDNNNAIFYAHKTADFKYIFTNNAGKYLTFKADTKSINGVSNGFADEYNNYYVFTLFPMQSFNGVSGDFITSSNPTTACLDEAGLFLLQGAMTTGRDDNHYLMANTSDKKFHNGTTSQIYYTSNNNTCAFAFEEAPQLNKFKTTALTVDNVTANIATYSSPFPVVLPKEVDAYIAVSAGETIVLKKITGALPKNTGVILSAEEDKDYIPTACTTEEVASIDAGNKLVASTGTAIDASTKAYVLAKNTDNKAVFKILSSNTEDRALAQYKAYLNLTGSLAAKLAISFNDNVTAINNATLAQEKASSIYDLSGRKSNKLQKGIYIVNGKKIIVK